MTSSRLEFGLQRRKEQAADKNVIRPFRVSVPGTEFTELRRRISATRWPEPETVTDSSQGVQLATAQVLARYWAAEYDLRKVEARLNALPNFITQIDGLDIRRERGGNFAAWDQPQLFWEEVRPGLRSLR